jgi:hypothetical protein
MSKIKVVYDATNLNITQTVRKIVVQPGGTIVVGGGGGGTPANIGPTYREKAAGTVTLIADDTDHQLFYGETAGQIVALPDPADTPEGKRFVITNDDAPSITVMVGGGGSSLDGKTIATFVRGFGPDGTTPAWYAEAPTYIEYNNLGVDRLLPFSTIPEVAPLTFSPNDDGDEDAFDNGSVWFTSATFKVKVGGTVYDLLAGPKITVSDTAPDSPAVNDLWYDTTAPIAERLKYFDGTDFA